jgi:hypothetical protein
MQYQDLMYFGHWNEGGRENEKEFMTETKEVFPEITFMDAYSEFKGYRQEVYLPEDKVVDYFAWVIAKGWLGCSLVGILSMSENGQPSEFGIQCRELAKTKYPECFIQEKEL